jgi:hypothetical protein
MRTEKITKWIAFSEGVTEKVSKHTSPALDGLHGSDIDDTRACLFSQLAETLRNEPARNFFGRG